MRSQKGFTLLELLVAVVIVGVLMAVAIPSYQSFRSSSIRADECIKPLTNIAFEAEKYKGLNGAYPANLSVINISTTSSEGNYTFNIGAGSTSSIDTSFEASCQPDAGVDPACGTMTINNFGARGATGGTECWR